MLLNLTKIMKYKLLRYSLLSMFVMLCGGGVFAIGQALSNAQADKTGTIVFGNNGTKINAATVTGSDNLGNTWTITTEGTTSFNQNAAYSQVGSKNSPATSITFTTTLPTSVSIKSMSAKFGGNSGTKGNIVLEVGNTTIGRGVLNETEDVEIRGDLPAAVEGNVLTVTVDNIDKGVKCYSISYTYEDNDTRTETFVDISNPVTTATVGEEYFLPTATVHTADGAPVENSCVTWSSSNEDVAEVAASFAGLILKKAGTAKITASFDGTGTPYKSSSAEFTLTVTEKVFEVGSIGRFVALDDKAAFKFTGEVLIVAKPTDKYLYVKDNTGSCLLYDAGGEKFENASVGKKIAANWTGTVSIYKKLFEVIPDKAVTVTDADAVAVEYPEVTISYVVADNVNEIVKLTGVTYTSVQNRNFTINQAGATAGIKGYNQFGITIAEPVDGATYTMIGAISRYNDDIQFQPISIEKEGAPEKLYICGDMTEWANSQGLPNLEEMPYNAETKSFEYTGVTVTPDYKISFIFSDVASSDSWEDFNANHRYAVNDEEAVAAEGQPMKLKKISSSASMITISTPGTYTIHVDDNLMFSIEKTADWVDTYFVAGAIGDKPHIDETTWQAEPDELFTIAWQKNHLNNQMEIDEEVASNVQYKKVYEGIKLAQGDVINYKFVKNGTQWIPSDNAADLSYTITESGLYTITFIFDPYATAYTPANTIIVEKQNTVSEIVLWECGDAPAPIVWWMNQAVIDNLTIENNVEVGDLINIYMTDIPADAEAGNWSYMAALAGSDNAQITRFIAIPETPTHVQQYYVSGDMLQMMRTHGLMPWGTGYSVTKISLTKMNSPYYAKMNTVWVGDADNQDDRTNAFIDVVHFGNVNNQRGVNSGDILKVKVNGVKPSVSVGPNDLIFYQTQEEDGVWQATLTKEQAYALKTGYLILASDYAIEYVAIQAGNNIDKPTPYSFEWKNNGSLEATTGTDGISYTDLFSIMDPTGETYIDMTEEVVNTLNPIWFYSSNTSVAQWDSENNKLLIMGVGEATITACCSNNFLYSFAGESNYAEYNLTVIVTDPSTTTQEDRDAINLGDFRKWKGTINTGKWEHRIVKEHVLWDAKREGYVKVRERSYLSNKRALNREPLEYSSQTGHSPVHRAAGDDELSMDKLLFTAEPEGIEIDLTEGGIILNGSVDIPCVHAGDVVRILTKSENDEPYSIAEKELQDTDITTDADGNPFIVFDTEDKSLNIAYIEIVHKTADGIEVIRIVPSFDETTPTYNLEGQRVTKDYRGVIIQNGRKINNK